MATAKKKTKNKNKKTKITFATAKQITSKLPGVEESTSYGTPALKVKGKLFARLKEDGETLVVKVDMEARDALLEARPAVLFITDHYLAYPWILVRLNAVKRAELAELLEEAWRLASPPRPAR